MKEDEFIYDAIIVGSGMGGMSAASLLAGDGYSVLVLEAAHALGGCSSSYTRKGFTFESGATTLIGFDQHQPMRILEDKLGVTIPKIPLEPSMQVQMGERTITRWRVRDKWIEEAISQFGEEAAQKSFWELSFSVADVVWKVSGRNPFFPPQKLVEWAALLKNDPTDVWVLPYASKSVKNVASNRGITNPEFFKFLDEQLMISAQAPSEETAFLFGAPAITYTNSTNYYVPGGLITMVHTLRDFIEHHGGTTKTKEPVMNVDREGNRFIVTTGKKNGVQNQYQTKTVLSNLPVWNLEEITHGEMATYFRKEAAKYKHAWGAFTMGIAFKNRIPDDVPLHHQIHLKPDQKIEGLHSGSIFVSLSHPNDPVRSPDQMRTMNVSAHVEPEYWFNLNGEYDQTKMKVQEQIIDLLSARVPGFSKRDINVAFSSTPVTWNNWVYRKKGRVGGIPQHMSRSLLDWTSAETPFEGFYLTGDTVFPGQGIPGVTLSGINVYFRLIKHFKTDLIR